MFVRRVAGRSMTPGLIPGDVVVGVRRRPRVGDIVIAKLADREIVKRVSEVSHRGVYLRGDNEDSSTDSRHYGAVNKQAIVGVVMIVLPTAVDPPKPQKPYAAFVGWAVAALLTLFALVHLFRIDTFIPILEEFLPGGQGVATFGALVVVLSEVFAVPFALRMKLSPLAHLISGALIVLAPLWWLLITIWTLGLGIGTGQLGQFVTVYATIPVLIANGLWLAASYWALAILGYNTLSVRSMLSKT